MRQSPHANFPNILSVGVLVLVGAVHLLPLPLPPHLLLQACHHVISYCDVIIAVYIGTCRYITYSSIYRYM